MGIAVSPDGKTAYVVLDNNDTLTKIDLTAATPVQGPEVRVGNVPHSVVISPDGKTAYVSNEAGRIATANDFQEYSNGTPVVAEYPTGTTATGTVSVVDLATFTVTGSIATGLHPTGMAFWGKYLLVANTYSDTISVIDTTINQEVRTIDLGLPIGVPGERQAGLRRRAELDRRRCRRTTSPTSRFTTPTPSRLSTSTPSAWSPVMGMIPVGYAPSLGCAGHGGQRAARCQRQGHRHHGLRGGAPSDEYGRKFVRKILRRVTTSTPTRTLAPSASFPCRTARTLEAMTQQVFQNNHWDLAENIWSAAGGNRYAKPVAIPEQDRRSVEDQARVPDHP